MKLRNIKGETQLKIRRYIEYVHDEEINGFQRGDSLFDNLSISLKHELNLDLYLKIIKNIHFLRKNFSEKFLIELSHSLQGKTFVDGEIITNVI